MATNYVTVSGDTPSSIAAKFYGDRSKGALIVTANPGLKFTAFPKSTQQKLITGQSLIIPDQVDPLPSSSPDVSKKISLFSNVSEKIGASSPDEVAIVINGQKFIVFDNVAIKFDYDKTADEFSFVAPFEPDLPEYRAAFKQIYQPTAIYIGGDLIITGQSTAIPTLSSNKNAVRVVGYSITGTLNKSSIIAPFEFDEGTTFTDIATSIASRFGLAVVVDERAVKVAEKPFEKRIEFSPTELVGNKLAALARQRGLILSSTYNGRLLISKPDTEGNSVQSFVSGELPAVSFLPTYNADALHTSYIAYAPDGAIERLKPENVTIDGFPQPGLLPRIKAVTPSDTDNQNLEDAVRAVRGREFADWMSINVVTADWRDRNRNLYKPNTLVTAKAPRIMIYDDTLFFIRSVTLNKSNNSKTAVIELILPEAYSGQDLKFKV